MARRRSGSAIVLRSTIAARSSRSISACSISTSPEHNRLAYRMTGLTDEWIDLGAQRRVTLTNLDPGDHVLEVRAANSDSVLERRRRLRLTIHRNPAPWASPLAYALYALAVVGVRWRSESAATGRRSARWCRRASRLEAEVQLRTRELVESNRQLAEAARAKSDFLDRMSHELRTPMNGVVGMTELLSRTSLSATQSHLTKTIRSSAQILLQIVNDLLDLSKIRAGKVALERLPVDLGQVLEECTSMFAGARGQQGRRADRVPAAARARACCSAIRCACARCSMNLVGNAVKFTERGEVVVRADVAAQRTATARSWRLAVTDTGYRHGRGSPWTRSSSLSRKPTRRRRAASAARAWGSRSAASSLTSWTAPITVESQPRRRLHVPAVAAGLDGRRDRAGAAIAAARARCASSRGGRRSRSRSRGMPRRSASTCCRRTPGCRRRRRRRRREQHARAHWSSLLAAAEAGRTGARRDRDVGRRRVARVAACCCRRSRSS